MAQSFDCNCGSPSCRGVISGAKDMTKEQLEGLWINGHIRELLEQKAATNGTLDGHGTNNKDAEDPTVRALRDALDHAEQVVEAARLALHSYAGTSQANFRGNRAGADGVHSRNGQSLPVDDVKLGNDSLAAQSGIAAGLTRRGPTSRELSGEMGGDTSTA